MKRTELDRKTTNLKNTSIKGGQGPATMRLAVSLRSRGVDLRRGRLYRVLPDRKAKADGYVRIVDGSGEDYLYPANYFTIIHVSSEQALKLFKI